MTRTVYPSRHLRGPTRAALALGVALGGVTLAAAPAPAQEESLIVGGSGQPAIEINLRAIENSMMAPTASYSNALLPDLREPAVGVVPGPTITLTPPSGSVAMSPAQPVVTPAAPAPPEVASVVESAIMAPPEPEAPVFEFERPEGTQPPPSTDEAPAQSAELAEPAPAPAPAPAVEEAPTQVAALPAAVEPSDEGQVLRVTFASGQEDLPGNFSGALVTLAGQLKTDETIRLQLRAYAGGTPETASQARRLSLTRALAVRAYLIGQGVRSTRIDVRALGLAEDGGPADRVDLFLMRS